jgi:16S rRNA G1207 methylase RsmC
MRANASGLGLSNVTASQPDDVPADVRFAAIYSNPPIRVGKPALHEMLMRWLRASSPAHRPSLWCSATWGRTRCSRG